MDNDVSEEFLEHLYNIQKSYENQMDIIAEKLYAHLESVLQFRDFSVIEFLGMGSTEYPVQTSSVPEFTINFQSKLADGRRLFFIDGVVYFQRYVKSFAPVMKGQLTIEPNELKTIGIRFDVMKKSEMEKMSV